MQTDEQLRPLSTMHELHAKRRAQSVIVYPVGIGRWLIYHCAIQIYYFFIIYDLRREIQNNAQLSHTFCERIVVQFNCVIKNRTRRSLKNA